MIGASICAVARVMGMFSSRFGAVSGSLYGVPSFPFPRNPHTGMC